MTDSNRKSLLPSPSRVSAFFSGLKSYAMVPGILSRHKLWHYQLAPALLSLVLSVIILTLIYLASRGLAGWTDARLQLETQWLDALITWVVGILAFGVMVLAFFFLQKHIVLVLLAPFLGRIAELVIRAESGPTDGGPTMTTLETIKRSATINTRSVALELGITGALVLASLFLPLIGPITGVLALMVQAMFLGNGLMDFPLEYRGLSVKESIAWSRQHRATATGLGAGYLLLTLIPVAGWMFAPTFGTVAGTLQALEELDRARRAAAAAPSSNESLQ